MTAVLVQFMGTIYCFSHNLLIDTVSNNQSINNITKYEINCVNICLDGSDYGLGNSNHTFRAGPLYNCRDNSDYVNAYFQFAQLYGLPNCTNLRIAGYQSDIYQLQKHKPINYDKIQEILRNISALLDGLYCVILFL